MKRITLFAAALAIGLTMAVGTAEAARVGGGKSVGMQRQMAPVSKPATAAPPQTAAPAPAAAAAKTPAAQTAGAAAQGKRSWMGPIAGLAAGLGLAALASYLGFGEELANMLMIGLLVFAVIAVIGYFMRKRAANQQTAMAGGWCALQRAQQHVSSQPNVDRHKYCQPGGGRRWRRHPGRF